MKKGWVYVLTNQGMSGLVKIGYTSGLPQERAKALYSTGVAYPFKVMYQVRCREYRQVEQAVHRKLAAKRVNNGREFFACSVQEAIDAIAACVGDHFISDEDFRPASERKKRSVREQVRRRKHLSRLKYVLLGVSFVAMVGGAVWQLGQKSNGGLKALTKEMLPSTASQPKATAVEVERPSEQLAANQYIWAMVGAADVNLRTCAAMSCEVVGILPAHQAVAVHPRSQTENGWVYVKTKGRICYPRDFSADGNCQNWSTQPDIEGWVYAKRLMSASANQQNLDALF